MRGVRDTEGCSGKSWNAIVESHLGGAGGRGGCWAGRAQLSHSSGSQKALLGALSLFRQEMSADCEPVGCHCRLAPWAGEGEVGVRALSQLCEPTLQTFWGRRPSSPGWEVQPLGEKLLSNNDNNSSYHSWSVPTMCSAPC